MRSTDFENNQRWFYALSDSFDRKIMFNHGGEFCEAYNVGRDFPRACLRLGIMRKDEQGKYLVVRKITTKDVLTIRKMIRTLRNNPKKRVDVNLFNQVAKEPKIEIQLPKVNHVVTERRQQTIEETSGGWSILWGLVKVNPKKTTRVTD